MKPQLSYHLGNLFSKASYFPIPYPSDYLCNWVWYPKVSKLENISGHYVGR